MLISGTLHKRVSVKYFSRFTFYSMEVLYLLSVPVFHIQIVRLATMKPSLLPTTQNISKETFNFREFCLPSPALTLLLLVILVYSTWDPPSTCKTYDTVEGIWVRTSETPSATGIFLYFMIYKQQPIPLCQSVFLPVFLFCFVLASFLVNICHYIF